MNTSVRRARGWKRGARVYIHVRGGTRRACGEKSGVGVVYTRDSARKVWTRAILVITSTLRKHKLLSAEHAQLSTVFLLETIVLPLPPVLSLARVARERSPFLLSLFLSYFLARDLTHERASR